MNGEINYKYTEGTLAATAADGLYEAQTKVINREKNVPKNIAVIMT